MTVSGKDVSYRKVDVDALDPEKHQEAEPLYDPDYGDCSGPNEQVVKGYLQANKLNEALTESLKNIPLKCIDKGLKENSTQLVLKVLTSFKSSEIEGAVKQLDALRLAVLLHYVLKSFEIINDSQASQQLCAWHSHIFNHNLGGHGVLNKVLTSRYRL